MKYLYYSILLRSVHSAAVLIICIYYIYTYRGGQVAYSGEDMKPETIAVSLTMAIVA